MSLRLTWKALLAIACCVAVPGCAPFKGWTGSKAVPGGAPAARTASSENLDGLIEAAPPAKDAQPRYAAHPAAKPAPKPAAKSSMSFFKGDNAKKEADQKSEIDRELAVARLGERRGESEGAKELYKKITEKHPNHPAAFHRLGILEARDSNFEVANQYFDQALQIGNPSLDLLSDVGYCLYLQNRFDEAERVLMQSHRQKPNHEATCNNLGLVLGAQGRYADALEMFKRVNSEAEAHANLAYCFTQTGDLQNAKKGYLEALNHDKKLRQAALAVIQVEEKLKQQAQFQARAEQERAKHAATMPPPEAARQHEDSAQGEEPHHAVQQPAVAAPPVVMQRPRPTAVANEVRQESPRETRLAQPSYISREPIAEPTPTESGEQEMPPVRMVRSAPRAAENVTPVEQAESPPVEREDSTPPSRNVAARPAPRVQPEPEPVVEAVPSEASEERPLFVMPARRQPAESAEPAPRAVQPKLIPQETPRLVTRPEPSMPAESPRLPIESRVERPLVQRPVEVRPSIEQPIVKQQPVKQPTTERPVAQTPKLESPVVERPKVESVAKTPPATERPQFEQPVVRTPPERERPVATPRVAPVVNEPRAVNEHQSITARPLPAAPQKPATIDLAPVQVAPQAKPAEVVAKRPSPEVETPAKKAIASPVASVPTQERPKAATEKRAERTSAFIPRENPLLATEPSIPSAPPKIVSSDKVAKPTESSASPVILTPPTKQPTKSTEKAQLVENKFFPTTPSAVKSAGPEQSVAPPAFAAVRAQPMHETKPSFTMAKEEKPSSPVNVPAPTPTALAAKPAAPKASAKSTSPEVAKRERMQLSSLGSAITQGQQVAVAPIVADTSNSTASSPRPAKPQLIEATPAKSVAQVHMENVDSGESKSLPPILSAAEFAAKKSENAKQPAPLVAARELPASGNTGLKSWISTGSEGEKLAPVVSPNQR